ncbi:MAG: glycosyltransferase [Tannerellaceae bacterium]|nr:glycosyltransferase [Tannerellaceae bacterium]
MNSKTDIKVSVIIPVYNVEKYLRQTLESCLRQTLREIEIIVVNDGSPDNSRHIIEEYAQKDTRIIPIHKKNEGVTIARNTGLQRAAGTYIFFLDGDDYLPEKALETLYTQAIQSDADFVTGDYILVFPDGKETGKTFFDYRETDNLGFLRYCFLHGDFYFMGRLIKRTFILSIHLDIPKEVTFGEDNIAIVQVGYQLKKAVKVNAPVLYYVQRDTSVTNKLKKKTSYNGPMPVI